MGKKFNQDLKMGKRWEDKLDKGMGARGPTYKNFRTELVLMKEEKDSLQMITRKGVEGEERTGFQFTLGAHKNIGKRKTFFFPIEQLNRMFFDQGYSPNTIAAMLTSLNHDHLAYKGWLHKFEILARHMLIMFTEQMELLDERFRERGPKGELNRDDW